MHSIIIFILFIHFHFLLFICLLLPLSLLLLLLFSIYLFLFIHLKENCLNCLDLKYAYDPFVEGRNHNLVSPSSLPFF